MIKMFLIQKRAAENTNYPWLLPPYRTLARADIFPQEFNDKKKLIEYLFKTYQRGDFKITFLRGGLKGLAGQDMTTILISRDGGMRIINNSKNKPKQPAQPPS